VENENTDADRKRCLLVGGPPVCYVLVKMRRKNPEIGNLSSLS